MRTERRRNHHDVHRANCGQGLLQIGVQVYAVDGGRIEDDARVDGRDQLDKALIRESGHPLGVDLPEPSHADQDEAGWRG